MNEPDFLEEIVTERSRKNPAFPKLVDEASARRRLAKRLAKVRTDKKLSQTQVAARMATSTSVVSKLENGADVKLSTYQRYCAAIEVPLEKVFASTR